MRRPRADDADFATLSLIRCGTEPTTTVDGI